MSDELSPRLALPFLAAGQAQKEVLVNEALQRVDALVQPVVQSADLAVPPATPATGTCWIVGEGASGAWAGREGAIAQWTTGGWRFSVPSDGWRCTVLDRGAAMIFLGGGWLDDSIRADGLYVGGAKTVGERLGAIGVPTGGAVIDSQARSVIAEILVALREHGLIES